MLALASSGSGTPDQQLPSNEQRYLKYTGRIAAI